MDAERQTEKTVRIRQPDTHTDRGTVRHVDKDRRTDRQTCRQWNIGNKDMQIDIEGLIETK